MYSYDNLRAQLGYLEENQIEQITQAYQLAKTAHQDQTRDTGEPYLTHPIAVAMVLAAMRLDYQSIMAALLHDVVEDTSISKDIILKKFGEAVAELVDGVTKLSQMEILSHAEAQAESFRKMVLAMSRDIRVILIKLADRLHNMQTLIGLPIQKRKRIAKETLDIYAPVANRIGMHMLSIELEDLAFTALYPRRYQILSNAVEQTRASYRGTANMIEEEFRRGLAKNSFANFTVFVREKHLYSIYQRMESHRISFADATNMYAFRIIVSNSDECYRALGVIHSLYKPVPGKFADYIAMPKFNGYQSLHTALFGPQGVAIEVQIRTEKMDQIANYGIVAPWLYKDEGKPSDGSQIRTQRWISNLLEMQQGTGSSLEFIDNVKTDLFPDEIYVFTPKGNIIELPKGATVIDFAYMVHTDIGNTCVAAKIDHQFTALSTLLANGQTISIITMAEAKPNPSWLNFVVTGRARSGIRNFLKNQKRSEAIEFGKELLKKSLADLGVSLENIGEKTWRNFLAKVHFKTDSDLYEEIGLGNQIAIFVAYQLINVGREKVVADEKISQVTTSPLLIKGAEGMAISFAPCCHPVPGEPIVGYLQVGQGLIVHREDCAHLAKMQKKPEMYVPVSWAEDVKGDFRVSFQVEMVNQPGALAALAQAVASAESNIDDIRVIERTANYGLVAVEVTVKNYAHLERVLRHISNLQVVLGVSRKGK